MAFGLGQFSANALLYTSPGLELKMLYQSMPTSVRVRQTFRTFAIRKSTWFTRSPYTWPGWSRFNVVLLVARPPVGKRPSDCAMTAFDVGLFEDNESPLVAESLPPMPSVPGLNWIPALSRTSTLGIVYDAVPRNCVSHGSVT